MLNHWKKIERAHLHHPNLALTAVNKASHLVVLLSFALSFVTHLHTHYNRVSSPRCNQSSSHTLNAFFCTPIRRSGLTFPQLICLRWLVWTLHKLCVYFLFPWWCLGFFWLNHLSHRSVPFLLKYILFHSITFKD